MAQTDKVIPQIDQGEAALGSSTRGGAAWAPAFKYQASKFENNTYSVEGLSYPEDLLSGNNSNPYGGNRVIFYINVASDSRVLKQGSEVAIVEGVQRDMGSKLRGAVASGEMDLRAGASEAYNKIFGQKESSKEQETPSQEKQPVISKPQKRLKAAIALYIPNQLNIRYSVGWGEEDTFALSAAAKGASEVGRSMNNDANLKRTGGAAAEIIAALALDKAPLGKEIGIATGIATNPKKEQAFKNVDFRTFSFDYQFAPRSESEAQNVLNIIRAFKYHMHPEFKSANEFLYLYPSEFDITYYKGENENLNIHRHTSCVLTEMNVNYTPNGVFTTFPNGMPTQIAITLTFKELMLLSKETIEKFT